MDARPAPPSLRLRAEAAQLVTLPWRQPLESWSPADAPVLELPLPARRHVVRVVEVGGRRWALTQLPRRAAEREHEALVAVERRRVPAVRPAGLVTRGRDGDAVLVTEHLTDAVSWRSLLQRELLLDGTAPSARVSRAVAVFLVELHRRGVLRGECPLSALVLRRDGQGLQPVVVDAETAEVHPSLTEGQRRHDLEVLQRSLAGGLLDVAAELRRPVDREQLGQATQRIAVQYAELWDAVHAQPTIPFARRADAVAEVSRLNDLGYAVEEVRLTSHAAGRGEVHLHTLVGHRRHRAAELQRRTGLLVGEGQAGVLLDDLRSHGRVLSGASEAEVTRSWLEHAVHPAVERLRAALPGARDVVQDYCDLLEVRWLLSERAGWDVGDDAAVRALAQGAAPPGSAAALAGTAPAGPAWPAAPDVQQRAG